VSPSTVHKLKRSLSKPANQPNAFKQREDNRYGVNTRHHQRV